MFSKNNEKNKHCFNGYNVFDIFEYDKSGINIKSQQWLQYELDRITIMMLNGNAFPRRKKNADLLR